MSLFVSPGSGLRAKSTPGALFVEGWLVRFTDAKGADWQGEYFTAETDFGALSDHGEAEVGAYVHHGQDPFFGKARVGTAHLAKKDAGVWAEYCIKNRAEYFDALFEAGGELGQSSGATAHLVSSTAKGGALHLDAWPVGEASLTATPIDPFTTATVKAAPDRIAIPGARRVLTLKGYAQALADAQRQSPGSRALAKALAVPASGLTAYRHEIERAFRAAFFADGDAWAYVEDVFPDHLIVHAEGVTYRVDCDANEGGFAFAPRADWQEARPHTIWTPVKAAIEQARRDLSPAPAPDWGAVKREASALTSTIGG